MQAHIDYLFVYIITCEDIHINPLEKFSTLKSFASKFYSF